MSVIAETLVKCVSCGNDLPESEFSPGLLLRSRTHHRCRACQNERTKQYQRKNRSRITGYNYNYWNKNPEKAKARYEVLKATKYRNLRKDPCWKCGNEKSEAHHFSYDPKFNLAVIWLCSLHHKELHTG